MQLPINPRLLNSRYVAEMNRLCGLVERAERIDYDTATYLQVQCAQQIERRGHLPDSDEYRALERMAKEADAQEATR